MVDGRNPPSQTWRTFLENYVKSTVAIDCFTVPTIRFQVLYVFLVLAHDRRRIVHFNVTAHPTAEWTGQQLREAFPFEEVPRYLLRDRDGIFGADFTKEVRNLGIEEVLSAPRSPWQRAYIERVIGSIRRECIDHMIVLNEASLYRHLKSFMAYYHETRTHLSLEKGHAGESVGATAKHGVHRCSAASRRTSSSVRTSGRVNWRGRELLLTVTAEAYCPFWLAGFRCDRTPGIPAPPTASTQCWRYCDPGTFA